MAKKFRKRMSKKKALSLVEELFSKAENIFRSNPKMSNRFVRKAVRISNKARMSLPSSFKKRFCRYCRVFWVFSENVRVRLHNKKVIYSCLNCKNHTRHPYVREKKFKLTQNNDKSLRS